MEFSINKTSDRWVLGDTLPKPHQDAVLKPDGYWYININSLEDLLKLQKECDYSLIVNGNTIEIYDEARE